MNNNTHAAYNLTTGEILTCEHANCLKKCVAIVQKTNREYFGINGRWIWAHGANAIDKVCAKANRGY